MIRESKISRKTLETDIQLKLNLDGTGRSKISTGIGFLDHILTLFTKHGILDLDIDAVGDLNIDGHHTVEDIGIVLGIAIKDALKDKKSIKRYGTSFLPMDEALVMVVVDLSGRPFLVFDANFKNAKVGDLDTELICEFFRAVSFNAAINLHIKIFYGDNTHHIIEAIFKAFGRAINEASTIDPKIEGILSTKGVL